MAELTEQDMEILSKQTPQTLAEWANTLNSWKWPAEIPDEESPDMYDVLSLKNGGPGVRESRRHALMRWIEDRVSRKLILRLWNHEMTDGEFNDFWRGRYENDAEAYARDRERVRKRVEARMQARAEQEWPELIEG